MNLKRFLCVLQKQFHLIFLQLEWVYLWASVLSNVKEIEFEFEKKKTVNIMMLLLELASQNEFNTESDQKVKWKIQVSYDIQ